MSNATTMPASFAPLHDELVLEAAITLRTALTHLEQARDHRQPQRRTAARHNSIELIDTAGQLLRRAEHATPDVHQDQS